jgi:hypothetical protein
MGRTSSPNLPVVSNLTSETETWGKRKYVNIYESDSDQGDPFYSENLSITMSDLSLNISTEWPSLPLKTENDIFHASSSCKKQLQMFDTNDTVIILLIQLWYMRHGNK